MPRLPRPLPVYDSKSDSWPTDDYYIEGWEVTQLNRIDQEWGCDVIIETGPMFYENDFCGLPEHDPFTDRCADHSPDNGGWNH